MPFVSRDTLKKLLFKNCVEIKYLRSHPLKESKTRRLFCVGCYPLFHHMPFLASMGAKSAFFHYPKGRAPFPPVPFYNPDDKNLVITYSIFDMDYRSINVRNANVIRLFPIDNKENIT